MPRGPKGAYGSIRLPVCKQEGLAGFRWSYPGIHNAACCWQDSRRRPTKRMPKGGERLPAVEIETIAAMDQAGRKVRRGRQKRYRRPKEEASGCHRQSDRKRDSFLSPKISCLSWSISVCDVTAVAIRAASFSLETFEKTDAGRRKRRRGHRRRPGQ